MEKFLEKMIDILDAEEEITMMSSLSEIEEWDSLSFVSFLAMADSTYGKKVSSEEVLQAKIIADLYNLVQ